MDKKYDFTRIEKDMQRFWKENEIYRFKKDGPGEIYSIDTPPPTVSGKLHIGHVFSYTQAEMIARFKRMRGYKVFYPFGFDDNGLPTERLVERELKKKAKDMPRSEFIKLCKDTTKFYEEEFKQMWEALGSSVDWNLSYRTIEDQTQRISQRSFLELVKDKKAYMKESPVLWCTECQTSIAQAELESKEESTTFHYLQFETEIAPIQIATTRPELLAGCVCIFINPKDKRYKEYIGKTAKVPLYQFDIPIMADEEVSMEKGTGVVMCATFGDSTDAEWFTKYQLPYKKIILPSGYINEEVAYVGGLKVNEARDKIVQMLKEEKKIIKQEEIKHTVGIHDRCGCEVEIIPSRQWYIDILSEKDRFLRAADEINWYPSSMKIRYQLWVKNLKWDWCISRQRYFGVPFPVWYCTNCGKPTFAVDDKLPVNPMESTPSATCECGCKQFVPETAVFDTWATSSLTPLINAKYKEAEERSKDILPMSMRAQAHEIIRTWAFYTIVKSLYHTGEIPWKDIMISGFVLAKKGEKISKSKNNANNTPINLIQTHSADAIRYWSANSKLGTDTFFQEEELKIAKRFITKLYNASKFVFFHLGDYEKKDDIALLPVDNWILERVKETTNEVINLLDKYEIGQARLVVDDLFWKDFCDYYIEIVKERLYQPEKHGKKERESAQYAIYHSLLGILKLYAIYTPHITEYLYQEFFKLYETEESIHCMRIDEEVEMNQMVLDFGEELKKIIADARKYKSEHQLSMKEEMEQIIIPGSERFKEYFNQTEKDLLACTNAKRII